MASLLFAPAPERRLLPQDRLAGPTAWLMAIMMFVTVIVAAAGLALAHAAQRVEDGVASRYSVEVDAPQQPGPAIAAKLGRVAGIQSAHAVPEAELRALLSQWLGPLASRADLPVPVMVDLSLAPGASPTTVGKAVAQAVPGARFVAHEARLAPTLRVIRMIGWLALALVLLMALATSAAVVLATRGALDTHQPTIEVMHGVGATDTQIARLFMRHIAIEALVGGGAGAGAAGLVLALLVGGGTAMGGSLAGMTVLGPIDALLLAMAPLIGAVMATAVARSAVLGALRTRP